MTKVEAIIQNSRLEAVKSALQEIGVRTRPADQGCPGERRSLTSALKQRLFRGLGSTALGPVVTAAIQLDEDAYGAAIRREIEAATERRCSIGALYTTLDRLETKGFVKTWMGDSTPQRGGRPSEWSA